MIELIKVSEIYNPKIVRPSGNATISCEKGECSISSDTDIMGIELTFKGKATITPQLPEGWYLRGTKTKMLIFTLQNAPIRNHLLFTYVGDVKIDSIITSNSEANRIFTIIKKDKSSWGNQDWSLNSESGNWDNFKEIRTNGKVNKTSYVIDDDLPEIKKTKIRKTVKTSTPDQEDITTGYTGGSSGGGY